ncbi:DUF72 domain-containing protein, partial [Leptolyngbya sp. FACHB-36]|uniref:DUF72 domain-containing protein n=1 Tax=Leptolyngbya sp. FACHB-36 TaxID=2692808 RepID=UPI0016811EFB
HSERPKPQLPLHPIVTAPFSLIRFISHPTLDLNLPFLREWVLRADDWLQQGTQLYFFVHCPQEERSPANARRFYHLLSEHGTPIPPLPWDELHAPSQLKLF